MNTFTITPIQAIEIFQAFSSNQNEIRSKADQAIMDIIQNHFIEGIDFFLIGIESQNEGISEVSSLLFHKKYCMMSPDLQRIPNQRLPEIIERVKNQINPAKKFLLLKRYVDIIIQIYNFLRKLIKILL